MKHKKANVTRNDGVVVLSGIIEFIMMFFLSLSRPIWVQ